MSQILLVESSSLLKTMLGKKFAAESIFDLVALSEPEAIRKFLDKPDLDCFLSLVSLDFPEPELTEIIDLVGRYLPVVVYTQEYNNRVRKLLAGKNIVDYVLNQTPKDLDYMIELIERLHANRDFPIMVVDDSVTSRTLVRNILKSYMFPVVEAEDGRAAIDLLKDHPEIRLIISDYIMPNVDGFELLRWIRTDLGKPRTEVAVIGLSGRAANEFSAQFIKNGGNDFVAKPFLKEEFLCRVLHNVEYLEHVRTIEQMAKTDFLTELFNRRHFLDIAEKLYQNAVRKNVDICLAMIDVDHFKHVNDRYGHAAGDEVLRRLSRLLKDGFRQSDLAARFGGEEFVVLAVGMQPDRVGELFDKLRREIEDMVIEFEDQIISVSISIGVTSNLCASLEEMISRADDLLYEAKNQGRNRVIHG